MRGRWMTVREKKRATTCHIKTAVRWFYQWFDAMVLSFPRDIGDVAAGEVLTSLLVSAVRMDGPRVVRGRRAATGRVSSMRAPTSLHSFHHHSASGSLYRLHSDYAYLTLIAILFARLRRRASALPACISPVVGTTCTKITSCLVDRKWGTGLAHWIRYSSFVLLYFLGPLHLGPLYPIAQPHRVHLLPRPTPMLLPS